MKFIPLQSFEVINSLIQDVEAQGCLVTVQLEAFTCRNTREEKQVAATIAHRVSATPPITPQPIPSSFAPDMLPPPMHLSTSTPLQGPFSEEPPLQRGRSPEALLPTVIAAKDVDERLVYLVAALNNIYHDDDYDFTVLTEQDFVYESEEAVMLEVNRTLQSLPEACGPAVRSFWQSVYEQVMNAAQGCEFFRFNSRECDPLFHRTVFSTHYFLYNRRRKVVVSIRVFGKGNQYRGDDACWQPYAIGDDGSIHGYCDDDTTSARHYMSSPELSMDDVSAGPYSMQKNRQFYGI